MNEVIQAFARQTLKDGLAQLTPEHHHIFKLMYSHKNLDLPIDEVVDAMPAERLDWAMQQVQRSINELKTP